MHRLAPVASVLFLLGLPAQEWLRYRGPGDLLPPQLGGAVQAMADLTVWQFAWEFQRDVLMPPLRAGEALPAAAFDAAVAALRESSLATDEELAQLALWSLARIARQHEGASRALREVLFAKALRRPAPVGEVAALALGMAAAGDQAAIAALRDLANDTAAGRQLAGQPEVPERTRCFALYGLGLAAEASRDAGLQFRVLGAVERLLLPDAATPKQVRIAALHALLLVRLDAAPKLPQPALLMLEQQWSLIEGPEFLSVRAQVPLAAAAMLRPEDAAAAVWRERLAEAVQAEGTTMAVRRSCAQALGRLCRPSENEESPDEKYSEVLRSVAATSRDSQTRHLALLALGMIGGANRTWLTTQLTNTSFEWRPWIALGLGAGIALHGDAASPDVIAALEQAVTTPNPNLFGGIATGLGLCRSPSSVPLLEDLLRRAGTKSIRGAPLCTALGLLEGRSALPLLRDAAGAADAPQLVAEAMQAMALFGADEEKALRAIVLDASANLVRRHAAATALRGKGDADSTAALARLLADAKAEIAQRHFAAFALGNLCDRSARHWSARLAASIDYRGATPVLVGLPNGVLRLP